MPSVFLQFIPPDREGFVKLHIFEAADATSALAEIEEVDEVGTYPNYISEYSTDQASDNSHWFAIQWEDSKGVRTAISARIQGGTETLVGEVVKRVRQRDSQIDENIALHEAEAVIEEFFGRDPYGVSDDDLPAGRKYRILEGLTLLALARSYLSSTAAASAASSLSDINSVTIGLVSLKSGTVSNTSTVEKVVLSVQPLIETANSFLGINTSVILQMQAIRRRRGLVELVEP